MIPPNALGMKVISISTLPENGAALIQSDPATGDIVVYTLNGDVVERIPADVLRSILKEAYDTAFEHYMSHSYITQEVAKDIGNAPSLSTKSKITGREPGRITRK